MNVLRLTAISIVLLLITGQSALAQEAELPEDFTQFCEALVGSWEGEMMNTMANGTEQTLPILCEYRKILNGTAIYGEVVLTVTPDFVVEVIQIIAWDAVTNKIVLFEVADNGEVAHSVGSKPKFPEMAYSLAMSKDTDKGKYEAATIMSFPEADTMLYKVRFTIDGEVLLNQKITLERQ